MEIKKVELYYLDLYKYLPKTKHTVLVLSNAQAVEDENIIRFNKGILDTSNGEIESFIGKDKTLKLLFDGCSRGSLNVKVNKCSVDKFDKTVNLELEVLNDIQIMKQSHSKA